MGTVTLHDGREVDSASPEWRDECLRVWKARQPEVDRHVATMQRMTGRQDRATYLQQLTQREGDPFAQRVKADFLKAWEKRTARP